MKNVALQNAKEQLAQTCRMIAYFGWDEITFGHCSLQLGPDHFLINMAATDFSTMSANQIVAIDERGEPLESGQPASFKLHQHLHAASQKNVAVLHSHHPHCVAMANMGRLAYASQYEAMIGETVFLKDIYTGFSPEVLNSAQKVLGSADVVFCDRHGVFVFGKDLKEAFFRLFLVCRAGEVIAITSGERQYHSSFRVPWPPRAQVESFWSAVGRRADMRWQCESRKAS